jgi:hypothetical protein
LSGIALARSNPGDNPVSSGLAAESSQLAVAKQANMIIIDLAVSAAGERRIISVMRRN